MTTRFLTLLLCLLPALGLRAQSPARSADNGDGTFTNPLLWADWPDPDVVRVGSDFYMVSTSMHYVPGCPILRSKDLVNWEMAGYAVDRYDDDPRYDMQGGTLYLNGAWASSIRHRDGKFYVAFCTPYGWGTDRGHFSLCTADDPAGPWERTVFPEYMYDPGLFFDDDGRAYVVHGQGTLYVSELAADLKSVKGEPVVIWDTRFGADRKPGGGFGLEGAHVYKRNDMYYVLCPAGGTEGWQVCLRSRSIYGPYEYKVVLDDDSSYPPNGLHQGGMVELENGDWWAVIMQDRGAIGRVPCLLPVTWKDGWPVMGADGRDAVTYEKPATGRRSKPSAPAASDEFDGRRLGLQWQWNHNPDPARWSLTARRGYLRLEAAPAADLKTARNSLTQRVQGPLSEATAELDASGLKDGNVAGLAVFEDPYAYVAVRQAGGKRSLVMCDNGRVAEVAVDSLPTGRVWLRARITDRGFTARFYYSLDGRTFRPAGTEMKMGLGLPWTANRFALFNFTTSAAGAGERADFNWFRFRPR